MAEQEVIEILRKECDRAGSRAEWARRHRVHRTVVDRILRGEDKLQNAVTLALGFRRVVSYERLNLR